MLNKYSLETLMKWIFMSLAISMVALTLGARLHQSYAEKKKTAGEFGRELSVIYDERKYSLPIEHYGSEKLIRCIYETFNSSMENIDHDVH